MERIKRYRRSFLGLAAGDALGATLEFKAPGTFEPIDDMVGGGPVVIGRCLISSGNPCSPVL